MNIPSQELHTLRDWVRWSASFFAQSGLFYGHGTDNALDEALELVLATLHLQHDIPESFLDTRVTQAESSQLSERIQQRVGQRMPLAYLTGRAYFAGLEFYVNQHVLIPRSPCAELIQNNFSPWLDNQQPARILDLCTGSGCIGIACAYAFPDASVDLVDLSQPALEVARKNIQKHQLGNRVQVIKSNLFSNLSGNTYDLIISNPPYVGEAEMKTLPAEYRHEPRIALAADGGGGMEIVNHILGNAKNYMDPHGILVVEVGTGADLLQAQYPDVAFLWLDFARGGEGVFLLMAEALSGVSSRPMPIFSEALRYFEWNSP